MNILFTGNNNYEEFMFNRIFFIEKENNILYFLDHYFLFEQNKPLIKDIDFFRTKTLEVLKIKKYKISIYYLSWLFNISENEKLKYLFNFNKFHINSKIEIDFNIDNNIFFYIKGGQIFECTINEIQIVLESKVLLKLQNNLKLKCKEILFVLDDSNFKHGNSVQKLSINLFKKNYWVYYSNDYLFQNTLSMLLYYDIILFSSSSANHLFKLLFKDTNCLLQLKNKKFVILRTCFNFDISSGYNNDINNIESNIIIENSKLYFARNYFGLEELMEKLQKMNNQIYFILPPIFDEDNVMKNIALPITKKQFDKIENNNYFTPHDLYKCLYNNCGHYFMKNLLKDEESLFNSILTYPDTNNEIKTTLLFPYVNEIKNKFTNYLKTNNYIETNNNISYLCTNPYPISNNLQQFKYFFSSLDFLKTGTVLLPDVKYSKEDFCKINNLNNENKIITIFIGWPNKSTSCNRELFAYDNSFKQRFGFEVLFYQNEKFIKLLHILQSQNFNVIIKCHPCDILKIVNNKIFFINDDKPMYMESIEKLQRYSIFIDNSFSNEIYKYTDYGIILSATTVSYYNYLYKFPILGISTKNIKYDWFIYQSKLLSEMFFGEKHYIEDIENNLEEILNNFFNYDATKFKYYSNHPFYGNAYDSTLNINTNTIIDIINKKQEIIENSYLCNLFNKCYDTKNIEYIINKTEITMKIINKPTSSYGISLFNNFTNEKYINIKLFIDAKMNEKLDDKYFINIYTGIKWITLEKELSTDFKTFELNADFNFFRNSLWRISSTLDLINKSFVIKNIKFEI